MARGVNKVILIGNLGQEPDIRTTNSGSQIANLSLATSEAWNDKNTGEKVEKTEWHRVVAFGRLAEIIGQHLHKGSKVYIEGKLQTRKWQDNNGIDRYTTEIVASELQMLDSRGQQSGQPHQQQAPQSAQAVADHYPGGYPQPEQPQAQQGAQDDFDDDIPF